MADHSVEATRNGVMESGQSENLGRQGGASSSHRSTTFNRRRSTSNHGPWNAFNSLKYSNLSLIVFVLCLFGFYHAYLSDELSAHGWFSSSSVFYAGSGEGRSIRKTGSGEGRSMLSAATSPASNTNCTKTYTAVAGDTCATLRSSQGLTQPQIFELNPELNCKTVKAGQTICVAGISAHCGKAISVTKGPANITCASIEASQHLSTEGFSILNPGISCPEAPGNNNAWPSSHLVCVFPGLGNVFFEYMGASGLPITFDDISPLVQEFSFVSYHVILAFAIDVDANGVHTNGTFYPYWSQELTPAAATAFKAANPDVQILMSLGGASKYVSSSDTVTVTWAEPVDTAAWIANAESSITTLVNEYSIDGIDIDYENFSNGSTNFAYCIGTLIEKLKASNTIGLATIAPFGSVLSEYQNLTSLYGDQIDYVNFQFYAYQLHTVASYISEYNTIAYLFPPWKLMASTAIAGNNSITGSSFASAVDQIQKSRGLAGVMLYDADHSVSSNFTDEKEILPPLNDSGSGSSTTSPTPPVGLAPGSGPAPSPGSGVGGAPKSSEAPAPASKSAIAPGAPTSTSGGGAPKSSLAPAPSSGSGRVPGVPGTPTTGGNAPKSSLAPAPSSESARGPGAPGTPTTGGKAPKSSEAPAPSSKSAIAPGAPTSTSGEAPKSSLAPAPSSGSGRVPGVPGTPTTGGKAPKSSLAPAPSSESARGPGAPGTPTTGGKAPKSSEAPAPASKSAIAPGSPTSSSGGAPKSGPAESPQSGHGGAPKSSLAPGTSLAPGSPSTPRSGGGTPGTPGSPGSPGSSPGSGSPGSPGSTPRSGGGGQPSPSSAPGRLRRGSLAFQRLGLLTTVLVLLFSL